MAKEKNEKTNLYLLVIVGIVAVVGIVVLVLNSGIGSTSLSSSDVSGQAIQMKTGSSFSIGNTKIMKMGAGGIILRSTPCCDGCDVAGESSCDECSEYCD